MLLALLIFLPQLIPGTAMTWTDGSSTWAGNPFCAESGFLLQPGSPGVDPVRNCRLVGEFLEECETGPDDEPPNTTITITTNHCPLPGSALNQPRLPDGHDSYCVEWYGSSPDIGACEFVPAVEIPPPSTPGDLSVELSAE